MKRKKNSDRHKNGFMARLPDRHYWPLALKSAKTGKPMTTLISEAIDAYFEKNSQNDNHQKSKSPAVG